MRKALGKPGAFALYKGTRKEIKTPRGTKVLDIGPIVIGNVTLSLEGSSPLIQHNWSEKAIKMMLGKQTGAATSGREPKDPEEDFISTLYLLPGTPPPVVHRDDPKNIWAEGRFGHPVLAFKDAAVNAANDIGISMPKARRWFWLPGDLTEIISTPGPRMRSDMVRLDGKTADIRFRAEHVDWSTKLLVQYDKGAITIERVVQLFRKAGLSVGVGEHRPERNGQNGTWRVTAADIHEDEVIQ